MLKLAHSLVTLAMLSGAAIAAHTEGQRGSDASDRLQSQRSVYVGVDATDAEATRNMGVVHGQLLQANGKGRITAYLQDGQGKNRMLMLADLTPSGSARVFGQESGSIFGYLYAAGQPDPHKTKSNVIVIGSYLKLGNNGSFDLIILDRRNSGLTSHVQMLGRVSGQFGQDGHIALLTKSPESDGSGPFIDPIDAGPLGSSADSADARGSHAMVSRQGGDDATDGRVSGPLIEPVFDSSKRGDSVDGRRAQVTKPAEDGQSGAFIDPVDAGPLSGDAADVQSGATRITKPVPPMVFAASVIGRWELN